jgi:nitrite reductase/ring-hydroxylating ferredoxin subunit/uncharacterized membrane protein
MADSSPMRTSKGVHMPLARPIRTSLVHLSDRLVSGLPWLDGVAGKMQAALSPVLGEDGPPTLKDALYGTWLGHPLHPMMTDLPIGFWTSSAVLDLAGKERASDLMLGIGTVSALGAAATGFAQWYDLQEMKAPRRLGALHAVLNVGATTCYAVSWLLRSRDRRGAGLAFSTAGLSLATAGGMLGGDLAYRLGIGVSRVAFEEPPGKWKVVAPESDLEDGVMRRVETDFGAILLLRDSGSILATSATCTHVGGPLDEGKLDGVCVTCPWHGSVFDLRDGLVRGGPATSPLHVFETRVREGQVEVRRRSAA